MGLLDVLKGMQNGPRGQRDPNAQQSGGMSPIAMALIALLGYKALKSFTTRSGDGVAPVPNDPRQAGGSGPGAPEEGGGLGDILAGGLGGLLGGSAGGVLTNGLGDLLKRFEQSGKGDVAHSWVDQGPNQPISPNDLEQALGADQIDALSAHSGLPRDELLAGLSQHLPDAVNHLTPEGRLPTEDEMSRAL